MFVVGFPIGRNPFTPRGSFGTLGSMFLDEMLRLQAGVITYAQARECGIPGSTIDAWSATGRWQRVYFGVYAAFSGPLSRAAMLWAAVLWAGRGAMLSYWTAAELHGFGDPRGSRVIHVTIPWERKLTAPDGIEVHRSRRASLSLHPGLSPPRSRVDDTVLDLVQEARRIDEAMSWPARAVQNRRTTPERLVVALDDRVRMRWRLPVREALGAVTAGAQTLLEIRYLRDVEQAHGLPHGERQVREVRAGRSIYHDVRYPEGATVVELDGLIAHPLADRFADRRRDNLTAERGDLPLRYGWGDIVEEPCATASQIGQVLRQRGWTGVPRVCGRRSCRTRILEVA
jgi:Transcriptional regulator, AbiEi antitoxin